MELRRNSGVICRAQGGSAIDNPVLQARDLELVRMLHEQTRRPVFLMHRGVSTVLFRPRSVIAAITIGYVGRLSPEKSVRVLRDVERALLSAGISSFPFMIVGEGHERAWLAENTGGA
jgi:hypothetical protein